MFFKVCRAARNAARRAVDTAERALAQQGFTRRSFFFVFPIN